MAQKTQQSHTSGSTDVFVKTHASRNNHDDGNKDIVIVITTNEDKTDDKGTSNEKEFCELISREIKSLARVDNKHVNKLIGYEFNLQQQPKKAAIVLEYAPFGTLFDFLKCAEKFELFHATLCYKQILDGLEACHAMNVIHRDLKPQNLFIDEKFNIKIADFGLSTIIRIKNNECLSPNFASYVGTVGYIAPEIISRKELKTLKEMKACDIFSSSIIYWQMINGINSVPFDEANPEKDKKYKLIYENDEKSFWDLHKNSEIMQEKDEKLRLSMQDLFIKLFEFSAAKRIDIDEIKNHLVLNEEQKEDDYLSHMQNIYCRLSNIKIIGKWPWRLDDNQQSGVKVDFGFIYRGVNIETKERSTVTLLSIDNVVAKLTIERIKLLQSMNHENIIRVIDFNDTSLELGKTELTIVSEYVPNGTLFDVVGRLTPRGLDIVTAKSYLEQILAGVGAFHEKNFILEDLQPRYLLISADYQIKIRLNTGINDSQTVLVYKAPELIIRGNFRDRMNKYKFASDVFSVGAIFFQLIGGIYNIPFKESILADIDCDLTSKQGLDQFWSKWMDINDNFKNIELQDLLTKMFDIDASKRITINEIKNHTWFKTTDSYNGSEFERYFMKMNGINGEKWSVSHQCGAFKCLLNCVNSNEKELKLTEFDENSLLPFHVACEHKNVQFVQMMVILSNNNNNKNVRKEFLQCLNKRSKNESGQTGLMIAISKNDLDMVSFLCENETIGSRIDLIGVKDRHLGYNCLQHGLHYGHANDALMKLLLKCLFFFSKDYSLRLDVLIGANNDINNKSLRFLKKLQTVMQNGTFYDICRMLNYELELSRICKRNESLFVVKNDETSNDKLEMKISCSLCDEKIEYNVNTIPTVTIYDELIVLCDECVISLILNESLANETKLFPICVYFATSNKNTVDGVTSKV